MEMRNTNRSLSDKFSEWKKINTQALNECIHFVYFCADRSLFDPPRTALKSPPTSFEAPIQAISTEGDLIVQFGVIRLKIRLAGSSI